MSLMRFESMLKTNNIYFFDSDEFEDIIKYYLEVGKHSLANKAVQLGLNQHPTSVPIKLLQIELLIFENKIEEAKALLSAVEEIEPNNEEIFIHKASILSKNNHHFEAIKVLTSSLKISENPNDIWAMIGMEYLYLDDYENAKLSFIKCVEIDCEDYSSLYNLVHCFEMQKQYNEAVKYLTSYIDKNPFSEVAWHQLGKQYLFLNKLKEALMAFDYSVVIDDKFIGGYLEKAKVLEKLNRYEEAIENYVITLKLDDPTSFAYLRIGKCFEKLGNLNHAIIYYEKSVEEDPLLEKGWFLLTDAYLKNNNSYIALNSINKAIENDQTNQLFWQKYAEINIKLSQFEEAVKALYKSIELGDEKIETHILLVDTLIFLGEYQNALKVLIKAKKIHQKFAEIEYRLFVLFIILNKKEYGLTHLKNGLAIDFDYHNIIKDLYPSIFEIFEVNKIIIDYKNNKFIG